MSPPALAKVASAAAPYSLVKPNLQPADAVKNEPASPEAPDFFKSHFGNPEGDEVYGTGNDYETEKGQKADNKVYAQQAIWYLGAFVLIVLGAMVLFGSL